MTANLQELRLPGHILEILYETDDGRHLDRPEPVTAGSAPDTGGAIAPTKHDGVHMEATFIRVEDGSDLQLTEERAYHIDDSILEVYETVYVLSYDETNQESTDNLQ
ncbi:hypothetical protein [Haloarchaeobius amylolyticus]|uniref:hypothetical protein n=1 Tax=Haloarchaeobius amylolyticus TaxID=1198296 RepID=UPI00226E35E6|nr:hypothetical protein [Haloarchaeobius amylolyticus]